MKGFKFRLETSYNLISWRENLVKQEVREKQTRYDQAGLILNQMVEGKEKLNDQLRCLQGQRVTLDSIGAMTELLELSRSMIRAQQEEVEQSLRQLDESWARLQEVRKEKKSLARLRERRYQEYVADYLRQEQKEIDEVAVSGYWRNAGADRLKETVRNRNHSPGGDGV